MWLCQKCRESNEDSFDACWKCLVPRGEVPSEPQRTPSPPQCAKCGSDHILADVRILDRSYVVTDSLTVELYEHPSALLFRGAHRGTLTARICGSCGYAEFYLGNPEDLYEVFEASRATATNDADKAPE